MKYFNFNSKSILLKKKKRLYYVGIVSILWYLSISQREMIILRETNVL